MTDSHALRASAFLAQALDLTADPADFVSQMVALKRDGRSGVWSIELGSSVGPAAFLIYDYQLRESDEQGIDGRTLFETDLKTLERAAELDTPGPRILAHAMTDDEAFILATTPAVHRALTGLDRENESEATEANLLPGAETIQLRQDAAGELMKLLREADLEARRWLRAIQAEGKISADDNTGDFVDFGEAESALALYLLDDRSIQHLLQALNLFIASAKGQASDAMDGQ